MKSNYKKVGDFISLVKEKNREGLYSELLGINIDKFFMPSVANIHGVDLSTYKVVRKDQFACNRMHVGRDYRIPISFSRRDEPFLVSPAYDVFEITDKAVLLPEYLMMWFSRKEFDRNAWFYTDADVRGGLPWSSFCEIELPIPSIEKQREIVKEYNTVVNRIALNEQLNQKLEETAQAIYRQWFVDFEFPNEDGLPFKSNGGTMIWCDELDKEIPEGWGIKSLDSICTKITKGTTPKLMSNNKSDLEFVSYVKGESIKESHHFEIDKLSYIDNNSHQELFRSQLHENDICHGMAGSLSSLEKFTLVDKEILPANTNQAIAIIRVDHKKISYKYVYGYFISLLQKDHYKLNIQQAVQANLSLATIASLPIVIPSNEILKKIDYIMDVWIENRNLLAFEERRFIPLKNLLLSGMTKVEEEEIITTI